MTSVPDHHDLMDADDVLADVERAVSRLVGLTGRAAGKAALTNLAPTIIWQRCRLGNVLEQIGVPLLRAAS